MLRFGPVRASAWTGRACHAAKESPNERELPSERSGYPIPGPAR
jgi:hypothetical protein